MVLRAVDEQLYLPWKIDLLLSSLCVLLYEHTADPDEYTPEENLDRKQIADRVRPELAQRKEAVKRAAGFMSSYVQDVVFPRIGLGKTGEETDYPNNLIF